MYRDLGLRWPRFTSEPRMKSVLGKLKTGVGVVLAAPTQSNCGDAAECLIPEKGLLHFTVTGSLESLLKFKRTIPNWLEHMPKETHSKNEGQKKKNLFTEKCLNPSVPCQTMMLRLMLFVFLLTHCSMLDYFIWLWSFCFVLLKLSQLSGSAAVIFNGHTLLKVEKAVFVFTVSVMGELFRLRGLC